MPIAWFDAVMSLTPVSACDAAFAVLAVLLGYLVLGLAGFGSALVVVPLLAWKWPLTLVVPLVLLIDVPASLLHTGLNLRRVAWGEIPRLVPAMAIGALAGAALLTRARSDWPLLALGLYITAVGVRGLRTPSVAAAARAKAGWAWPAGIAMGLVETMFGTAGPVVVAWLGRRLHDPLALRATLPITIVVVASIAIAGSALGGSMNEPLLWLAWPALLPAALLGVVLGHRIAGHLSPERVRIVVFGLLVASGLAMAARTLLSMLHGVG